MLQADPYMVAGETWWLSEDIRVFATAPGALPLTYSNTPWPGDGDPNTYIQNLLTELNTNPNFTNVPPPPTPPPNTPFSGISTAESNSQTSLSLTFDSANPVYNFALARVHLQGDSTTLPVRVFFRLFISPSPDTDFNNATTFRSYPEPDPVISLLGFRTNDMTSTIPFFAAARVNTNTNITTPPPESMTGQPDTPNAFPIKNPTSGEVYAYYGCYLDLNQGAPRFPLDPATATSPNGPWSQSEILPIPAIIMSQHACIVAEIAYDPDPIPAGANAATSDKIGQRNTLLGRRGYDVFRCPPDLASVAAVASAGRTDDRMGERAGWKHCFHLLAGNRRREVLSLASRFYRTSQLTKSDDHTIQCVTGTIAYIPIPAGTGPNLAGLLTVELPKTVRTGEQFSIVVRRLSWKFTQVDQDVDPRQGRNWRYVVGAFQMNIAVRAKKELLLAEENILALYKWKIEQIPSSNRWHPVMRRYIARVSGLIRRLGGDPGAIGPSQTGFGTGPSTRRSRGGIHRKGDGPCVRSIRGF